MPLLLSDNSNLLLSDGSDLLLSGETGGGGGAITFDVDAAIEGWQDTGLTLHAGKLLKVAAPGIIAFNPNPGQTSTADGQPGGALGDPARYAVQLDIVPAYGLGLLLLPVGTLAPAVPTLGGAQQTANVLFPGSSRLFTMQEIMAALTPTVYAMAPWRVWAIMNDNDYSDNSGSWHTTLTEVDPVPAPVLDSAIGALLGNVPEIVVIGH